MHTKQKEYEKVVYFLNLCNFIKVFLNILGIYRGFSSTILREIPFSFIQFPIWEYLKSNWTSTTNTPLTSLSVSICGAIAGGIAASITTPLDVAKTRIMLADQTEGRRLTVYSVLSNIYRDKGVTG